jgi:hypothetical protein
LAERRLAANALFPKDMENSKVPLWNLILPPGAVGACNESIPCAKLQVPFKKSLLDSVAEAQHWIAEQVMSGGCDQ